MTTKKNVGDNQWTCIEARIHLEKLSLFLYSIILSTYVWECICVGFNIKVYIIPVNEHPGENEFGMFYQYISSDELTNNLWE